MGGVTHLGWVCWRSFIRWLSSPLVMWQLGPVHSWVLTSEGEVGGVTYLGNHSSVSTAGAGRQRWAVVIVGSDGGCG